MCPSFPFGIEGGMWDAIVLIPDHYLSIYFLQNINTAILCGCLRILFEFNGHGLNIEWL